MKNIKNNISKIIIRNFENHKFVLDEVISSKELLEDIKNISMNILKSIKSGGKIIVCGNGGSFADALHFNSELIGRYKKNRKPIPSIVLGSNPSSLTAISNDFHYDNSFVRDFEALAKKNDFLIAISTSGKSKNVLKVINKAINLNIDTVFFTGKIKNNIKSNNLKTLNIPSKDTARIQELYFIIFHIISEIVEKKLF